MGRKRQWPPLPRPHPQSGQERVRWAGHDYYLGPIGSEQARKAYADLLVKLAEGEAETRKTPQARQGISIAEVVLLWETYASERFDPTRSDGRIQYKLALNPVVKLFATLPAKKFGTVELDQVREEMIRSGLASKVIARRVTRIKTVWRWAERKGHVPEGRWAALRALEPLPSNDARVRQAKGRETMSETYLEQVAACCSLTVASMLRMQFWSGARSGEIRGARIEEIDRSAEIWVYRPPRHKNSWRGKTREIYLGPKAQAAITACLQNRNNGYLFEASSGKCYTKSSYPRAVSKAADTWKIVSDVGATRANLPASSASNAKADGASAAVIAA
jgi:integrase